MPTYLTDLVLTEHTNGLTPGPSDETDEVGVANNSEDRGQQMDTDRTEVGVDNVRVGNSEWALTVLKWALLTIQRTEDMDTDRIEVGVVNIRVGNSEWVQTILAWALLTTERTECSKRTLTALKWGLLTLE